MRSQNEFAYGGDASVKRPELNKETSDAEWDNFVYLRKSSKREAFRSYGITFLAADNGLRFKEIQQPMKYLKQ